MLVSPYLSPIRSMPLSSNSLRLSGPFSCCSWAVEVVASAAAFLASRFWIRSRRCREAAFIFACASSSKLIGRIPARDKIFPSDFMGVRCAFMCPGTTTCLDALEDGSPMSAHTRPMPFGVGTGRQMVTAEEGRGVESARNTARHATSCFSFVLATARLLPRSSARPSIRTRRADPVAGTSPWKQVMPSLANSSPPPHCLSCGLDSRDRTPIWRRLAAPGEEQPPGTQREEEHELKHNGRWAPRGCPHTPMCCICVMKAVSAAETAPPPTPMPLPKLAASQMRIFEAEAFEACRLRRRASVHTPISPNYSTPARALTGRSATLAGIYFALIGNIF